jgi:hypothetical protein
MPTLVKEDGTRPANANSYASVTDCDTYVENRAYGRTEWTAKSADDKARCLITATLLIDSLFEFSGYLTSITQVLKWPRNFAHNPDASQSRIRNALAGTDGAYFEGNEIPAILVRATCEQALMLALSDRTAPASNEGISSVEIFQAIKVQFERGTENTPPIPALVQQMLAGIGIYRSSLGGAVRLQRA